MISNQPSRNSFHTSNIPSLYTLIVIPSEAVNSNMNVCPWVRTYRLWRKLVPNTAVITVKRHSNLLSVPSRFIEACYNPAFANLCKYLLTLLASRIACAWLVEAQIFQLAGFIVRYSVQFTGAGWRIENGTITTSIKCIAYSVVQAPTTGQWIKIQLNISNRVHNRIQKDRGENSVSKTTRNGHVDLHPTIQYLPEPYAFFMYLENRHATS